MRGSCCREPSAVARAQQGNRAPARPRPATPGTCAVCSEKQTHADTHDPRERHSRTRSADVVAKL
eukprot:1013268-Heterocapsa_arctica.AAC.1